MIGLCKQHGLDADYQGYKTDNRLGLHFFPYRYRHGAGMVVQTALSRYSLSRVIQPTTGWGYTFLQAI